jgi:hypothetical protein
VVGDGGNGILEWDGVLAQDMLEGTDTLVNLAEPAVGRVVLDQAAGTARYEAEDRETVSIEVMAGWVNVRVTEGPAAWVISYAPGDPASVWAVMLEGGAAVTVGQSTQPGTPPSGDAIELEAGDAAGFTLSGPVPEPMTIETAGVEQWFIAMAAGSAEGSIGSVALRCRAKAPVTLKVEPDPAAADATTTLAASEEVGVVERNAAADWLLVRTDGDDEGWAPASALTCNGPVSSAPSPEAPPTAAPSVTVPVATLPTRLLVTRTPTLVVATMTTTPTPTATGGVAEISFSVSDDDIASGECVTLRWDVKNIRAVYLDGGGVTGKGEKEVCPSSTTEYVLRVVKLDGSEESRSVTVRVRQSATTAPTVSLPTSTVPVAPSDTPPPPADTPEPTATPPTGTPES